MTVKLIVKQGPTRIRSISLNLGETVVGRGQNCKLRIPSAEVSRRHCLFRYQDGCLTVEDLASANGTFLNEERIAGQQVVKPGDRVKVGPLLFEAEYQLSPQAFARLAPPPPATAEEEAFEVTPLEEEDSNLIPVQPVTEEEIEPMPPPEDEAPIPVEMDFGDMEQMHQDHPDDLRNLLSQIEETSQARKPRRR